MKRLFKRALIGLGLVIAILLLFGLWVSTSESGLQWSKNRVSKWVSFEQISGTLSDKISFTGMTLDLPTLKISIDKGILSWSPTAILKGRVFVNELAVGNVGVTFDASDAPSQEVSAPFSGIKLPIDVELKSASVDVLSYQTKDEQPIKLSRLSLKASVINDLVKLDQFKVTHDQASVSLDGTSKISSRWLADTNFNLEWSLDYQYQTIIGNGVISGDLRSMQLEHHITAPFTATTSISVTDLVEGSLGWDLKTNFSNVQLAMLNEQVDGYTSDGLISSQGSLNNWSLNSKLNLTETSGQQWVLETQANAVDELLSVTKFDLSELPRTENPKDNYQNFSVSGELIDYRSGIDQSSVNLLASWSHLQWPLDTTAATLSSNKGQLEITGPLQDYVLSLAASVTQATAGTNDVRVTGNGSLDQINLPSLSISGDAGELNGSAEVIWQPTISWNSKLQLNKFNPGIASPQWAGNLAADINTQGEIVDGVPKAQLAVKSLEGTLREKQITGSLAGSINGKTIVLDHANVNAGTSKLNAKGTMGDQISFNWELNSPDLSDILPDGSGQLSSRGAINGTAIKPQVNLKLNAKELSLGDLFIGSVDGAADVDLSSDASPWKADWTLNSLSKGNSLLSEQATLTLDGDRLNHVVNINSRSTGSDDHKLTLSGKLTEEGWAGTLINLAIESQDIGTWQLADAAPIEWSEGDISIKPLCIENDQQSVCTYLSTKKEVLSGRLNIKRLNNNLFNPAFEQYQLKSSGQTTADLSFSIGLSDTNSAITFNGEINSDDLSLTYTPEQNTDETDTPLELPFEEFNVVFSQDKTAQAKWDIRFAESGLISGNAETDRAIEASTFAKTKLKGTTKLYLSDLSIIPDSLSPGVDLKNGEISLDAEIFGELSKPALKLDAKIANTDIRVEETGTDLSNMTISLTSLADYKLKVDSTFNLGEGELVTQAIIDYANPAALVGTITAKGESLTIMNSTEIFAVAGVDMSIDLEPTLSVVKGNIVIDEASIRVNQPASVVKTSNDVVIAGDTENAPAIQQQIDIEIDLGEDTKVAASGFDGLLTGKTRILQLPGKAPRGEGKISVKKAKFSIFSQELDIDKGEVFYAGGALDNPEIFLEASKTIDSIKVGVRVTGRVKTPDVALYSEPSLNDQDILSYLVFEKSVDEISPSDAFTLAKIANSLRGNSSGGFSGITKNLTKRLGLTDLEVNATGADAGLKLGKQLSSKLYIGYGYGLLDAVQTLFLRYNINDLWSIQSDLGADSGADVRYQIERD